jgi:NTE family protein
MRRVVISIRGLLLAVLVGGCASIHNEPINVPLGAERIAQAALIGREGSTYAEEMMIGLAFSGGGTRAAAFSFGALQELERTRLPARMGQGSMLDRIDFVSGVSGGSVSAAYFALKKRDAMADFREKFLLRDAEEALRTRVSVVNLSRALGGGINDSTGFTRWLDESLFHGATFMEFAGERRPRLWINASDIYNRTPFVFGRTAFAAMCSDLGAYPLADAVAASAAVPVVFAPIVIKTYPGQCPVPLPPWVERARTNPASPPLLKAFAEATTRYHDGSMPYIKLLDGGLVDNFGLSGFTIARLSADTPYGPLTPEQAVKLRRGLFMVIDAGRGPSGNWNQAVEGPSGPDLVMAAADTAIDASVRSSFTAFSQTTVEWQSSLIRWRCGLSAAERRRLGAPANWNCRDIRFVVGRVGFDQLGPQRAAQLDKVPTRFKLPAEQVDALIEAGGEALRASPTFRGFVGSL